MLNLATSACRYPTPASLASISSSDSQTVIESILSLLANVPPKNRLAAILVEFPSSICELIKMIESRQLKWIPNG